MPVSCVFKIYKRGTWTDIGMTLTAGTRNHNRPSLLLLKIIVVICSFITT